MPTIYADRYSVADNSVGFVSGNRIRYVQRSDIKSIETHEEVQVKIEILYVIGIALCIVFSIYIQSIIGLLISITPIIAYAIHVYNRIKYRAILHCTEFDVYLKCCIEDIAILNKWYDQVKN